MDNPRPEKVAVVNDVRERWAAADAVLLTEYRGIDVAAMQTLRRALRAAGGEYKIYKNTLVRFAARELGYDLEDQLTGPTALTFVAPGPDGVAGDPVMVAKALKEFAKTNPNLVVKGGVLGDKVLDESQAKALADVAPRDVLLAQLAGLIAAPMQQFAGLLKAVPQSFAYGLQALIDAGGAPGAPTPTPAAADEAPIATTTAAEASAAADEEIPTEAPAEAEVTETPATEAADTPQES